MNSIRLSPLEWHILIILWQYGASTPEEIYHHLALIDLGRLEPSFFQTTILLDDLCLSGYLQFNESGETYSPVVQRSAVDRWYIRWLRGLWWRITSLFRLEWSSKRQHILGFNDHLPDITSSRPSSFKISLSHPKLLSKRFSSSFMVHIYLANVRRKVVEKMKAEFDQQKNVEHLYGSPLTRGHVIRVKLFCPEIDFSDPVIKKLDSNLNTISFLGKPKDDCHPGVHQATLVICDEKTGYEFQSVNFPIKIVDFVFGHVSRPFLTNCMTAILSVGSLAMFLLTLLGRIDTTFGLTSGTTAGALAGAIYVRFLLLYKSFNANNQP